VGLIGVPEEETDKYIKLNVTDIRGNVFQGLSCFLHTDCIDRFTKTAEGDSLFFTEQSGTLRCRFR